MSKRVTVNRLLQSLRGLGRARLIGVLGGVLAFAAIAFPLIRGADFFARAAPGVAQSKAHAPGPPPSTERIGVLETDLAHSIASLAPIESARVHLALAQDSRAATASVVLRQRAGQAVMPEQAVAIQHLVAAAVPELQPARVTIVDGEGRLLARGDGAADANAIATQIRAEYETRLAHSLEALLEQTLGPGKARVDVHAEMDFDRVTTVSESYDADGQVVRSTETVTEPRTPGETGRSPASPGRTSRLEERTQYEIPKTVRNQVRETGVVHRLSVAALVDGSYASEPDGTRRYEPRSADELKQLSALLRTAVGYDEHRGDTVDVVNLRFAAPEEGMSGIAFAGAAALARSALLLVVILGAAAAALIIGRRRAGGAAGMRQARGAEPGKTVDPRVDGAGIEGRVTGSSLGEIGEIVDKHPDQAVAVLRSWMYQSA